MSKAALALRGARAVLVALTVRTHRKRWEKVAFAGRPPWDLRNERIASFIPERSSVLDLGCGAQTLKEYLPAECEYQPCDLVKSSPNVIQCDFNAGVYPKVGKKYSHVVCSGVLEYIRSPHRFLKECATWGDTLILSYNTRLPGDSKLRRMTNHWINHFSKSELEEVFREAGFKAECLDIKEGGEAIYRLTAATAS